MIYPFTDDEARYFPPGHVPSEKYRAMMQRATDDEELHHSRMREARSLKEQSGTDLDTFFQADRAHDAAVRDYEYARSWRRSIHPSWLSNTDQHKDLWERSG